MRVWYLAGPMSGIPEDNYPAFTRATTALRQRGYTIVSPHEEFVNHDEKLVLACYRKDVRTMLDCDGLVLLRGWTKSRGVKLELQIALALEMPVLFYDLQTDTIVEM